MTIDVREYLQSNGDSPYARWFETLDARAAAKIASVVDKFSRGLLGDVKSIGGGVSERRIDTGPGYRIYFGSETDGQTTIVVILLLGGTKKRQAADISQAKTYWKDYKLRKRQGEV